jgi:hypothetical protein
MPNSCLPKSATPSCAMPHTILEEYEAQLLQMLKNPLRHWSQGGRRGGIAVFASSCTMNGEKNETKGKVTDTVAHRTEHKLLNAVFMPYKFLKYYIKSNGKSFSTNIHLGRAFLFAW